MLLREAIAIPEAVRQGDLVFKITDATEHVDETLRQYVVTDQLRTSFIEAVGLVGAAVQEHASKAAFLTGSFGAGKSNFMGVLQLLLDGNPAALAKPELAPVVANLNTWRKEQKFLTVPFHLIGATSIDSAIFGGYVDYVRARHPDAVMPNVFADEPILVNADNLRSTLGDETFFEALNASSDDGWGSLSGWTADRYDAARPQASNETERQLLVQSLIGEGGLLAAYADGARANREGYVDIDHGLSAISRHAADLGYSGLILFLDELILWLMSRMADSAFVAAEASKLSKLVEASERSRPVPIISIIARQRDLRDLIGSDVPGTERLGFVDQLDFQAGRFSDIRLDDSNLPVVAHHRLLQPIDTAGGAALSTAFASLQLSDDQREALRGVSGTDADFKLTYPFSPAFLTIVVDVAGALQRTRTGLRVLLDLLVRNRETFTVGQLVPVGDLFDVLAESDEPLSDAMKQPFEAARRIYRQTLRPVLLAEHGLTPDAAPTQAFVNDDRLVKTLLLAALVPNSEPFRNLTARRLVALNHGLISSPVPGMETTVVVDKLQKWAARAGELQVSDDPHNPTVHLVLSDIDTRAILNAASAHDNPGARRKLIRDLIAEELGIPNDQMQYTTKLLWRGIQRDIEIVFANIRDRDECQDSVFTAGKTSWKVVIDYPFDEEGHTPLDDLARIQQLRESGHEARTACWVPSFFTAEMRGQIGDLVCLNYLVPIPGQTSDRLRDATKHLSAETREAARPQMEAQQRAARQRLQAALRQAYGLTGTVDAAIIDESHGLADHFPAFLSGLQVQPPVARNLREAIDSVVHQMLEHTYSAAPKLESEVRLSDLRTVYRTCLDALEESDHRISATAQADRKLLRAIANPLRLGVQSEQAFLLDVSPIWDTHFTRKLAERKQAGNESPVTVGDVRSWIDEPSALGLTRELQNLIVLVWAAATNRTFLEHGGPARVDVDSLADAFEVVAQPLPDDTTWTNARERAIAILGSASLPQVPSAVGLARLTKELSDAVTTYQHDAANVVDRLTTLAALTGEPRPTRLETARRTYQLLQSVSRATTDIDKVSAFITAEALPSPQAIGASLKASAAISSTIAAVDLEIISAAIVKEPAIGADLAQLLATDELAKPLAPALRAINEHARGVVIDRSEAAPPYTPSGGPTSPAVSFDGTPGPTSAARALVARERALGRAAAEQLLERIRDQLHAGEIDGESFDIEITANTKDAAE